MPRHQPIDPEVKARAIAIAKTQGISEASRQTGVSRPMLSQALAKEGFKIMPLARQTENATAVAKANRAKLLEESQARMTSLLTAIAELAARTEIEFLNSRNASLSEVVGARTRAIHDLQLLSGQATARLTISDDPSELERLAAELDELAAEQADEPDSPNK